MWEEERMGYKLEKIETNTAKLEVTVPSENFINAIDRAYHKNIGKFNVPGFRNGKAPRVIIENLYGKDIFHQDAAYMVVDDTWPEVVRESKIEPVDSPNLTNLDFGLDKDLVYTVTVTVKPEVKLGQYKGVEAKRNKYDVTDEDVQKQLESMQEKNARIITKTDGTIEKGNIAVIDFEGFIDGVAFKGGKGTNYSLEIGSGSFIEGFEDQLIGKKTGDDVDVRVKFPDDYTSKELAGKDATFKVKIDEVKYKELPALDDEFAKDVSEFETLDALKEDIKKKQQQTNDDRAKREFENDVLEKAVANATVEIPKVMVDNEIDYMIKNLEYRLKYQGITLEQYIKYAGTTMEKVREDYRESAERNVKTNLVLEAIGSEESVDVTDDDLKKEIDDMSKQYGEDAEKFKSGLKQPQLDMIKDDLKIRKTVELLVQNAAEAA